MAKKRVCRGAVKFVDPALQSGDTGLSWAGAGSGSPVAALGEGGQAGPSASLRSAQDDELRDMGYPVQLEVVNPPVPFGTRTGHTGLGAGHTGFGAKYTGFGAGHTASAAGHTASGELVLRKSPRPSGCSRFVRREIADAMPAICAMLLTRVIEQGDLSSLKVLLQMAAGGQSAEREGSSRSMGFGRKILVGFKEFEARESGLRREN